MAVDPDELAERCLEVAQTHVERLAAMPTLSTFEVEALERLHRMARAEAKDRLALIEKLDPEKLPDEVLRRLSGGADDGGKQRRGKRPS